jgi:hypothetical protein
MINGELRRVIAETTAPVSKAFLCVSSNEFREVKQIQPPARNCLSREFAGLHTVAAIAYVAHPELRSGPVELAWP